MKTLKIAVVLILCFFAYACGGGGGGGSSSSGGGGGNNNPGSAEDEVIIGAGRIKEISSTVMTAEGFAFVDLGGGLVAYGAGPDVVVYNANTEEIEKILSDTHDYAGMVYMLAKLSDGRIVSGCTHGLITVWKADFSGVEKYLNEDEIADDPFLGYSSVDSLAVLPDDRIVSGSSGVYGSAEEVKVWDADLSGKYQTLRGSVSGQLSAVATLPNGQIVTKGVPGLQIWKADLSGKEDTIDYLGAFYYWSNISDKYMATYSYETVDLWDKNNLLLGYSISMLPYPNAYSSVFFSGEYAYLTYFNLNPKPDNTCAEIWKIDTTNPANIRSSMDNPDKVLLPGHEGSLTSVFAMPDGRIASGSSDGPIKIWVLDASSRYAKLTNVYNSFPGHANYVNVFTALPDLPNGRLVSGSEGLSSSGGGTINIWNPSSTVAEATLSGHTGNVRALAVLSDGSIVSGASMSDYNIRVWKNNTIYKTLNGHTGDIYALAVLPGDRIVSASGDKTVRVWDADLSGQHKVLNGHTEEVISLAILPDGRIVSGSYDNTIRVWDADLSGRHEILEGNKNGIVSLGVTSDGRIVSGSYPVIKVWKKDLSGVEASFITDKIENLQPWENYWIGHNHGVLSVFEIE